MNIKFNFYDIYGFALPGFLLLALLWLPFGLIKGEWPEAQLSSALLGVIVAYIVGHVLQTIAGNAIPSNFMEGRWPSSVFLDPGREKPFTTEFKRRLAAQIEREFGLNVQLAAIGGTADDDRSNAFFLCRSALIKSKTVKYAEQFEGLYALMRGLCVSFAFATAYYLGWAYAALFQPARSFSFFHSFSGWRVSGLLGLIALAFALAATLNASRYKEYTDVKWVKNVRVMIVALLVAAFAAGYYLGMSRGFDQPGVLLAAAILSAFASHRCYLGYKSFAMEFAKAVYRDFSNYEKPAAANGNDYDDEP